MCRAPRRLYQQQVRVPPPNNDEDFQEVQQQEEGASTDQPDHHELDGSTYDIQPIQAISPVFSDLQESPQRHDDDDASSYNVSPVGSDQRQPQREPEVAGPSQAHYQPVNSASQQLLPQTKQQQAFKGTSKGPTQPRKRGRPVGSKNKAPRQTKRPKLVPRPFVNVHDMVLNSDNEENGGSEFEVQPVVPSVDEQGQADYDDEELEVRVPSSAEAQRFYGISSQPSSTERPAFNTAGANPIKVVQVNV